MRFTSESETDLPLVLAALLVVAGAALSGPIGFALTLLRPQPVGIYGALITLNYALQVAYVPYLARTQDPALGYVTMAHGAASTWVLEMFGYGVLGVATFVV